MPPLSNGTTNGNDLAASKQKEQTSEQTRHEQTSTNKEQGNATPSKNGLSGERIFFLTEILGTKAVLNGKKVGKLVDFTISETGKIPEVTHAVIHRPFGDPSLFVPWDRVTDVTTRSLTFDAKSVDEVEGEPPKNSVLLRDHILDKKVVDMEDREVDVVYDVRMVLKDGRFYVTDVDFSRNGLLRRIGLRHIANFITGIADSIKDQTTSWKYIQQLPQDISSFKGDVKLNVLKEKLADMPPVDLAEILQDLSHEQRVAIFSQLETTHASHTLEEVDPSVQRSLVSSLKKEKVARLIEEMTPGQAADVLVVLPSPDAETILNLIDKPTADKIRQIIAREEERVMNFVVTDIIKYSPETSVQQARASYRDEAKGKDAIMYLYIVDPMGMLLGVVDLKELLQAEDEQKLSDIMTANVIALETKSSLAEASELFERYGFRAAPVVDENNRIIGVVPYRDVMKLTHHFMG